MPKATYKRKHLIWGLWFQKVRVHDRNGREHGSRHSPRAVAESSHLEKQPKRGWGEKEEERREDERGSKLTRKWLGLLKPQSPALFQQGFMSTFPNSSTKYSQIWAYGTILIQTTINAYECGHVYAIVCMQAEIRGQPCVCGGLLFPLFTKFLTFLSLYARWGGSSHMEVRGQLCGFPGSNLDHKPFVSSAFTSWVFSIIFSSGDRRRECVCVLANVGMYVCCEPTCRYW